MLERTDSFKWNPFTLEGEAPSSLRWKTQDDELEFATKEDLEEISKNPALLKAYNAMKAGVTKKFQEWGGKSKSWGGEKAQLEDELAKLEDTLAKWDEWYGYAFPQGWKAEPGGEPATPKEPDKGRGRPQSDEKYTLEEVVDAINKGAAAFEQRLNKMENALTLTVDLVDLYRAHPEADGKKILSVATERGLRNLDDAYGLAYKDELIKRQVDEGVKKGIDEATAKSKATAETGSGSVPITHFERPKEVPKTFSQATKEALVEHAKGELTK